jgi:WhiB family redox-sensing transcriptional regulator
MKYPPDAQPPAPQAPFFDGSQPCAGVDVDLFFPPRGGAASGRAAKAICATCPFLEPCLEYAVHAQGVPGRYVDGIWGGTNAAERLALRMGRGHVKHPVAAA